MSAGVADLPAASCAGFAGITQKMRYVMIVATKKRKTAQKARRMRNAPMFCLPPRRLRNEPAGAPKSPRRIVPYVLADRQCVEVRRTEVRAVDPVLRPRRNEVAVRRDEVRDHRRVLGH